MNGAPIIKRPAISIRKRAHNRCIRTNISLPPMIFDEGKRIARMHGFSTLSGYIQDKIRRDLESEKNTA